MSDHEQYEVDLMRHALAWPKQYRNHFCADPGSLDDEVWKGLVSQGQAELFRESTELGGRFYRVTENGKIRLRKLEAPA